MKTPSVNERELLVKSYHEQCQPYLDRLLVIALFKVPTYQYNFISGEWTNVNADTLEEIEIKMQLDIIKDKFNPNQNG